MSYHISFLGGCEQKIHKQSIMHRWHDKIAVVTGAASGIGEAITRELLKNGVNVFALDIEEKKLAKLAKLDAECKQEGSRNLGKLQTKYCDVNNEDEIDKLFTHIETLGGVDIMVNNARIIRRSQIIDTESEIYEKLLDTNVLAVAVCMNKAVNSMRNRNSKGHIFTITSVASHSIMPVDVGMNVYGATKHAYLALAHTVRLELAKLKSLIRFTTISLGSVETNKFEHSGAKRDFFKNTDFQPSDIADAIIYALGTRPEVQITQLIIQPTGDYN